MKEKYSINEILNAIDDLQDLKKKKNRHPIIINKTNSKINLIYLQIL